MRPAVTHVLAIAVTHVLANVLPMSWPFVLPMSWHRTGASPHQRPFADTPIRKLVPSRFFL
jgi:hypothetical protein